MCEKVKYAILVVALALTGCVKSRFEREPAFKVGDCFVDAGDPNLERWEEKKVDRMYKVLEVGKKKYRLLVKFFDSNYGLETDRSFWIDDLYRKVDCIEDLK